MTFDLYTSLNALSEICIFPFGKLSVHLELYCWVSYNSQGKKKYKSSDYSNCYAFILNWEF